MNEMYWYKSSQFSKIAELSEIIEFVRLDPNQSHKLWLAGWPSWRNWYEIKELRSLKEELDFHKFKNKLYSPQKGTLSIFHSEISIYVTEISTSAAVLNLTSLRLLIQMNLA